MASNGIICRGELLQPNPYQLIEFMTFKFLLKEENYSLWNNYEYTYYPHVSNPSLNLAKLLASIISQDSKSSK